MVLGWLWVRSLSRALVTPDTSTGSSRLRGTALPLARYGLRGAVAARFWIYQRRDPTSLVYWAITAIIMVVISASTIFGPHQHPGVVIASAVVGAGFVGYLHANSVGLTGPPFVIEALALTSRRSLRAYFSGQNIALGVIAVPLLIAVSVGLAAGVRHPMLAVAAIAVALAGLGAALGLGNIFTVTLAYPMAKRAGSPMRQAAQGYGSYTFAGMLATLAGVAVAVTPVHTRGRVHQLRSAGGPDTGADRLLRRLRPRAGPGRRADRSPRSREKAARAVPDRHPQHGIDRTDPSPTLRLT